MPDGRDWNGLLDDTSDIGDGLLELDNCSLFTKNMLNRRPGFDLPITLANAPLAMEELAGNIITVESGGAIRSYVQSSGAATALQAGYTTTNLSKPVSAFSRIYLTNVAQAVKVIDTSNVIRDAGIVAPSGTPTGGTAVGTSSAGTHLIRYRYVDSTRNRLSNPSTAVSVTSTAAQSVTISVTASGDSLVTGIQIEMTAAGASAFYIAATNANTTATATVALTDDLLVLKVPTSINGDFGHAPPPQYRLMCENRQRMWMMDPTSGLLAWSQPGFPESFDTTTNARVITMPGGDVATALFGFYSDLYIVGQRSMMRLVYSTDPAGSMLLPVLGSMGCYSDKVFTKTSTGEVFGWGRDGMWRLNTMQPVKISKHVTDHVADAVDPTAAYRALRFVCYDPIQQAVMFFFVKTGETQCRGAFAFDVEPSGPDAEWKMFFFRQSFACACYNSSSTDRQRIALGDNNAYIWRYGTRDNDGGAGSALSVTSATTTVINGTNAAVIGMIAYRPTTGEENLITAATAGSITTLPFSTAPAAGELIYCGSIRERWLTQWNTGNSASGKKRPSYLELIVHPQAVTSGVFTVRFYLDFASSPSAVTSGSADTWPNGISIINGTDIRVDAGIAAVDGYIAVPMFADFQRAVAAEIIADYPATGLRFYDFKWGYTNSKQQVPVVGE